MAERWPKKGEVGEEDAGGIIVEVAAVSPFLPAPTDAAARTFALSPP